ncbi:Modular serine protease [Anthophora quadrimaculata]
MKNTIILIVITIISSLTEYAYAQNNKCGLEKFQCKNGQCIASSLLCDGKADCKDKSDETERECNKPEIACPDYAFRCLYGACVDGDATCNGIRDCIDNSDETLSRCTGISQNVSTSCTRNQFNCNNGQCIPKSNLCDGTADCADGSDETFIQCGSLTCSQLLFRCNYGACIDGDLKCNGVENCADGSDENPGLCRDTTISTTSTYAPDIPVTTSTRPYPLPTLGYCTVPPQPENGYWKLHKSLCCNVDIDGQLCDHCDVNQGTRLEQGTRLIYGCKSGYMLRGNREVFCDTRGNWLNIPVCTEIRCKALQSASRKAECTYHGEYVSCASPVLPWTVARLSCRISYNQDKTLFSVTSSQVTCNTTGQWEPEPIRCIAACGHAPPRNVPLIVNGSLPNISEFPWHATLYRAESPNSPKTFICGATVIHETLLITAAHCVYDEINRRIEDASKFYIITGNIYRDYDSSFHDKRVVKKAKVKNVYIRCTYLGLDGNYAEDIAVLEVTQSFGFTTTLIPICLDFSGSHNPLLEVGILGKVAGFGRTAMGASSFVLQAITVPYVALQQCKSSSVNYETEKYITADKFCAGYTNGTSVCDGDSGGGLVVRTGGLWYLGGIVSVSLGTKVTGGERHCDSYTYSLYTRVFDYMTWIQNIVINVGSKRKPPTCFAR